MITSWIFRVIILLCFIVLLLKGYRYYEKENVRTESTRYLIRFQQIGVTNALFGLLLISLKLLGYEIPYFVYVIVIALYYGLAILGAIFNLGFMFRVYSVKPREFTFKVYYAVAGIIYGMLFVSLFSTHDWYIHLNPPVIIMVVIGLYIAFSTVLSFMHARLSAKHQSSMLIKYSMLYYANGSLAILFGLLFIIILFFMKISIYQSPILGDIVYIVELIDSVYRYLGFFHPPGFIHLYKREPNYLERVFTTIKIKKN